MKRSHEWLDNGSDGMRVHQYKHIKPPIPIDRVAPDKKREGYGNEDRENVKKKEEKRTNMKNRVSAASRFLILIFFHLG